MKLVDMAVQRRAPLANSADTNAYRLLNGAADGVPELTVDRYAHVLVANIYDEKVDVKPYEEILRAIAEQTAARAIYVKHRPAQANTLDEDTRNELAPPEPLWGDAVDEVESKENGMRFIIRPGEGLNTGLFSDMREVRAFVRDNAAGKLVLNCFAYTCAFGVAALCGGAARALNLDVSRNYLDWGERNTALNGFDPIRIDFLRGDVFDWLGRFDRRAQKFDMVIVDPPSYSKTRETRFTVKRDYAELVARAARVVTPGGTLIACTNYHQLSHRAFMAKIREGLRGCAARIERTYHEPEIDFPIAPGAEPYLKVCVARISAKI